MHRNETQYWIDHFGRTKFRDTAAERGLARVVGTLGGAFDEAEPVGVRMADEYREAQWLTLYPDGWIIVPGLRRCYGYADGPHHWTEHERRKDLRLRVALARCGLPSIGVDSPLLETGQYVADVVGQISTMGAICRAGESATWQAYA